MTTVVDELILKFSLDPTQFNQQQQKTITQLRKFESEAKDVGSKTEDATQRMVNGFSLVTKEVLGLGAAFLGVSGLKDLISGTVSAASALQVQSQYFNTASEAANRYANAVKVAGGSSEAALQAFNQVGLRLQRLQSGADSTFAGQEWLQILGINPMNYDPKHPENLIGDIIRGAQQNPDRKAAIMEGTGVGAFGPLANLNPGDLAKLLPEMLSLTNEQAKNGRDISASVSRLMVALETRANQIFLNPTATGIMKGGADTVTDLVRGDLSKAQNDAKPLLDSPWWAIGSPLALPLAMGWAWNKMGLPVPAALRGGGNADASNPGADPGDINPAVPARFSKALRSGIGGAGWTAPYANTPMGDDMRHYPGFGHFGHINNDYSHAVSISHMSITAQTSEPADFASRFQGAIDSVTSQASWGGR